jgi:hypothetical protein
MLFLRSERSSRISICNQGINMDPDILLVRQRDGYRVLHGHLHLASVMSTKGEAMVEASGEGKVKVSKTAGGIVIGDQHRRLPLLMSAQQK